MMFKPLKAEIPSHSALNEIAAVQSHDLLISMLAEQRRTNALLSMLIESLAEDQGVEDMESVTYMDGTPR